jgi:glucose/arabinose dehydrogenase
MKLPNIFPSKTLLTTTILAGLISCTFTPVRQATSQSDRQCTLVEDGFGATGTVNIQVEEVVTGLEVPWGIAFLPDEQMLVTERAGRIRLVRDGELQPSSVATIDVTDSGEG